MRRRVATVSCWVGGLMARPDATQLPKVPATEIANPAPSDATDADELLVLRASGNCLHRRMMGVGRGAGRRDRA
jgi:hypothetical protein